MWKKLDKTAKQIISLPRTDFLHRAEKTPKSEKKRAIQKLQTGKI